MSEALMRLAATAGILPRYKDNTGTLHETSEDTAKALLTALGLAVDNLGDVDAALGVIHRTESSRIAPSWVITPVDSTPEIKGLGSEPWQICLEDGTTLEGRGTTQLPPLPLGIHSLWISGQKTVLLAAPDRLLLPQPGWGLMVPLWGLRGPQQGGLGDFGDLGDLADSLKGTGPSFIGVNPIHAGFPGVDTAYSPYQPSHRRRLNTAHIPVPGAAAQGALIDYGAELAHRRALLAAEFARFAGDPRFDAFVKDQGPALERFARHQTLAERFGPYWTDWPAPYQSPEATIAMDPERIRYHAWLQWRADTALAAAHHSAKAAGLTHGLYLDLAVGTHPAGAETWENPNSFVRGASLGAPPDDLGPDGQNWGLAPLHPQSLIADNFQTLAETLRCQFRHCGIVRIDHILGFERAFWVPENGEPGAYVSMPRDAMLAVARIEAARAGGVIVGEDLGVVPDGLRAALDSSGILGCRVAMFERDGAAFRPATAYPEAAIASFSTHDLPTWAGWRQGQDLEDWARLGVLSAEEQTAAAATRSRDVTAFDAMAQGSDADALHRTLADTPSRLIAVQAETVLDVKAQPNMPGTIAEYPNWRHRLPIPATEMVQTDAYKSCTRLMQDAGRSAATRKSKTTQNVQNR